MSRATAPTRSMCEAAEKGCKGRGQGFSSGQLEGSKGELCVDMMIKCEPGGRDWA
jgi:hypothetical protein